MPSDLIRGWRPVRVKKTRQIKNLEPRFDSIETEMALALVPLASSNPVTRACQLPLWQSCHSPCRSLPASCDRMMDGGGGDLYPQNIRRNLRWNRNLGGGIECDRSMAGGTDAATRRA